ncbi:putative bifunctional diguanylate cyclase/phosphodiesterase [Candidatus Manganitrophus noduliformans]|uniref:EAL domain-containing protein n=1 Tax=Candidatus Manganitrophus noduliformans TaxID=2606439 RepID=A0A7X6IDK1_9BACT|nr:EAL domain-containing protein [Candidatus Manganitrophus noduliformans]NKE73778.1 EAL domain-containing protein [Candidatus Manganitrophus noduliformans]
MSNENQAYITALLTIITDAIITVDQTQRITFFSQGAERTFGYQVTEVIGQSMSLLLPSRFVEVHREQFRAFAAGPEPTRLSFEIFGRRKDGSEFPAEVSLSKLSLNDQILFIIILRDIIEHKHAEEMLQLMAHCDSLTGLPNRTRFRDLLRQAVLAGQYENKSVALLLMDLDQFKEVNDTLGHDRGDLLIQHVGRRLKEVLRPTDTVARLGGDEFALILPLAEAGHATLVASKVLKALEEPFEIEGLPIAVELSLGIALYPEHGSNADSLIQRADVAMYAAKRSGSGYTLYTPEQDPHSPRRLALAGELRHAIDGNQLLLHYQPQVNMQTGRITGVEALVRWQHPQYGIVPPDQFILPAERTGLIKPLTQWVLKEALRQSRDWNQKGLPFNMAVNLSARNLHDSQLPDRIAELLEVNGMAPSFLELEVTESAIMQDQMCAKEILTRLSKMGIRLSIDDFGTGYSSLNHHPVNAIKIDRTFVRDMTENQNNAVIVRSIIDLGHNLGLEVIAEGVENHETWNRLLALGCDAAQGYYMSPPVSAQEIPCWMKESPWGLA